VTVLSAWTGYAFGGRALTYRLSRGPAGYLLEVKPAESSDDAYRPATEANGHGMALRVADLIREEQEHKIIHVSHRRFA
jgi:hypothetical protein